MTALRTEYDSGAAYCERTAYGVLVTQGCVRGYMDGGPAGDGGSSR
jgi:hypothetical protein